MKNIKKSLIIVGCFIALSYLCVMTYDNFAPKLTVGYILDEVIALNYDRYNIKGIENLEPYKKSLMDEFIKTLSYDIKDSQVKKDTAVVTVALTYVDAPKILEASQDILLKNSLKNLSSAVSDFLSGGTEKLAANALIQLLQDDTVEKPYKESEIEIALTKEKGLWIPKIDEEIIQTFLEDNDMSFQLN